jgi:hypothetical protein
MAHSALVQRQTINLSVLETGSPQGSQMKTAPQQHAMRADLTDQQVIRQSAQRSIQI